MLFDLAPSLHLRQKSFYELRLSFRSSSWMNIFTLLDQELKNYEEVKNAKEQK